MNPNDLLKLCDCENCPIAKRGLRNPVLPQDTEQKSLALVVEFPTGRNEFLPQNAMPEKLLRRTLELSGVNLDDVHVTGAVLCHPGKNQKTGKVATPTKEALDACGKRLQAELHAVSPVVTIATGATAARATLQTKKPLPTVQGVMEWSEHLQTWVIPTYHPAFVLMETDYFFTMKDDLSRAVRFATGKLPLPDRNATVDYRYFTVEDISDAYTELAAINNERYGNYLAFDVETDGLDVHVDKLLQVAVSNGIQAWVFDAELFSVHPFFASLMKTTLKNPHLHWIMHNMRFDLQYIRKYFNVGAYEFNNYDTMCLAMGVTETGHSVSLKNLSRKYFSAPYYEDALSPYLTNLAEDVPVKYSLVPGDVLAKYAAADVIYTQRLFGILQNECQREKTAEVSNGLLMHAQRMFAEMEYDGIAVDTDYVDVLRREMLPKIEEKENEIAEYAKSKGWEEFDGGRAPLNPRSRPRLAEFLFDVMRYVPPMSKKVKEARRAGKVPPRHTGAEFYEKYPNEPITKMLQDYGQMTKLMQTYVAGIMDDLGVDNRVHPDFIIQAARTGRLSMKRPPLQTIPTEHKAKGFGSIRKLFKAAPRPESGDDPNEEWVFIGADYRQLELRIGWYLSGDENMGAAILSGDFHATTASQVFEIPVEQVTEEQRKAMKYVSFGIMYGRTEHGLHAGELGKLGYTLSECRAYRYGWLERFPVFAAKNEALITQALKTGRLQTVFGRVRRWGLITQQNVDHVKNQAINFPGQSVASDLNIHAAIRINRKLRDNGWGRGLFIVHDSIECEVRKQFLPQALELIYQEMVTPPFETDVIFDVEIEYGPTWGDMEPWHPDPAFVESVREKIRTTPATMEIETKTLVLTN